MAKKKGRYADLIELVEPNKKKFAEKLAQNAEFMEQELEKLQEYIKEHGCTEEYQNGATQFGKKKSSEADMYCTMVKQYNSTVKQLIDLLPVGEKQTADEFKAFLQR